MLDCVTTQGRDTASQVAIWHGQALGVATRRWVLRQGQARAQQDAGRCDKARAQTGAQQGRAAWACCWAAGCALGEPSLFLTRFYSVLFLSQILDTVHELGS